LIIRIMRRISHIGYSSMDFCNNDNEYPNNYSIGGCPRT
jgi:hypothetical protein